MWMVEIALSHSEGPWLSLYNSLYYGTSRDMPDSQHSVSVAVSRCRSRFRKNRVRTGRLSRFMPLLLGACARQAQAARRRVSRAKEWAELQARRNGRYGKIELDLI